MNFPARLAGLVSSFSDSDYAPISGACQWEYRESTQPTRSVIRLEPVTQPTRRRTAREFNFYFGFVGAGGGSRTLIPSEGCGILSPVRLPVPPLQRSGEDYNLRYFSTAAVRSSSNARPQMLDPNCSAPHLLPCRQAPL